MKAEIVVVTMLVITMMMETIRHNWIKTRMSKVVNNVESKMASKATKVGRKGLKENFLAIRKMVKGKLKVEGLKMSTTIIFRKMLMEEVRR